LLRVACGEAFKDDADAVLLQMAALLELPAQDTADKGPAVAALRLLSMSHQDLRVRLAALWSLSQVGPPDETASWLSERLSLEPDVKARGAILEVMKELPGARSIEILSSQVRAGSDRAIAVEACQILGALSEKTREAKAALTKLLGAIENEPALLAATIDALAKGPPDPTLSPRIDPYLSHPEEDVRVAAVWFLLKNSPQDGIKKFGTLAANDASVYVRKIAVQALTGATAREQAGWVRQSLESMQASESNPDVRRSIKESLSELQRRFP
jgi:HEAT repeat protein